MQHCAGNGLFADALRNAGSDRLHATLDGTIGDAQAFCWGALRQYDCCNEPDTLTSPRDFGLQYADLHYLLIGTQEAVSHAERVEQLLVDASVLVRSVRSGYCRAAVAMTNSPGTR